MSKLHAGNACQLTVAINRGQLTVSIDVVAIDTMAIAAMSIDALAIDIVN